MSNHVILEHLKYMSGQLDIVALDLADPKSRMASIEVIQGQAVSMLGGLGKRMDRFDKRLSLIEKRLDLEHA